MQMVEICFIVVNALSFAFQIAGAAILLLWSLGGIEQKVVEMSRDDGISMGDFYNGKLYTTLSKEKLQANAKAVCLNIAAFADLLIGYTCAIFAGETSFPKWGMFLLVAILTVIILLAEKSAAICYATEKYPEALVVEDK